MSQRKILSHPPAARVFPSGLKARLCKYSVPAKGCPICCPVATFQRMTSYAALQASVLLSVLKLAMYKYLGNDRPMGCSLNTSQSIGLLSAPTEARYFPSGLRRPVVCPLNGRPIGRPFDRSHTMIV